jgi:hypothetical protein
MRDQQRRITAAGVSIRQDVFFVFSVYAREAIVETSTGA